MTKQIRNKRIVAILIVLVMALSLSVQAFAAPSDTKISSVTPSEGYTRGTSSGTTGIMNSLFGQPSGRWPITVLPLPSNTVVTSVTITFTVSSGSDPCYIYVMSPSGTIVRMGPYGPGTYTVTTNLFNGEHPSNTWYVWIQTLGTVSTVSYCRLVINYNP